VIYASTFGFVLALAAVVIAALAWRISWTTERDAESRIATLVSNVRQLAAKLVVAQQTISELKRSAPTTLAAEVVALREAVDKLADTQRRFAGRFDARMGKQREGVVFDGDTGDIDEELTAMLALQKAAPPAP